MSVCLKSMRWVCGDVQSSIASYLAFSSDLGKTPEIYILPNEIFAR